MSHAVHQSNDPITSVVWWAKSATRGQTNKQDASRRRRNGEKPCLPAFKFAQRQDDQETEEERGACRVTTREPRVRQHLHVRKPRSLPREEGLHLSVNVAPQIHRDPKHGQVMPPPEQDHSQCHRPSELSYKAASQVCPDLKDQTFVGTKLVKKLADWPIHFGNDPAIAHVGCQKKEKSRTDTPEEHDLFRDDGQN
jgi:hypothetical protein